MLVKLWNEGEKHEGGTISGETGKVYPNYVGVAYVEYEEETDEETGETTINIISVTGVSSLSEAETDAILNDETPNGYTLIDYNKAGIDPYEYLELP